MIFKTYTSLYEVAFFNQQCVQHINSFYTHNNVRKKICPRSTLLDVRPHDFTSSGFVDWPFMTVHSWGENPIGNCQSLICTINVGFAFLYQLSNYLIILSGVWKLTIYNNAYSKWSSDAKFFKWSLVLHGVEYDPNTKEYKQRQRELKQLELKRQRELEERPLRRGKSYKFKVLKRVRTHISSALKANQ